MFPYKNFDCKNIENPTFNHFCKFIEYLNVKKKHNKKQIGPTKNMFKTFFSSNDVKLKQPS